MIRRELGIWRRLNHNHIVPFLGIAYGFGVQGGVSLVSLWMPNSTLLSFLVKHDDELDVAHRLQLVRPTKYCLPVRPLTIYGMVATGHC